MVFGNERLNIRNAHDEVGFHIFIVVLNCQDRCLNVTCMTVIYGCNIPSV